MGSCPIAEGSYAGEHAALADFLKDRHVLPFRLSGQSDLAAIVALRFIHVVRYTSNDLLIDLVRWVELGNRHVEIAQSLVARRLSHTVFVSKTFEEMLHVLGACSARNPVTTALRQNRGRIGHDGLCFDRLLDFVVLEEVYQVTLVWLKDLLAGKLMNAELFDDL